LGTGKVARIVDGRSLVLEDGREVLISGIEIPSSSAPGEPPGPSARPATAAAKAALEALLLGQVVELRGLQDVIDRYGRTVAFVVRQDGAVDTAGDLLAHGHARVAAQI